MKTTNRIVAVAGCVLFLGPLGCKQTATDGAGGASLSSVAIKLPSNVRGVNKATLTGNTSSLGSDRKFSESINSTSDGGSVISFTRDTQNNSLKVGDNLYTVTLQLLAGSTIVYEGTGNRDPFIIEAGENKVSFRLECKEASRCPQGSDLEVIEVDGSTADAGSKPSILADISVDDNGTTTGEKRDVLRKCQTEVRKKSCNQWGVDVNGGDSLCDKVISANASSVCEGGGTFSTCLDDYLGYCKDLGVVR